MPRVHHPMKLAAERRFLVRVDIPVPATGFGNRLNEMEAWCRANFHADQWVLLFATSAMPADAFRQHKRRILATLVDRPMPVCISCVTTPGKVAKLGI